MGTRTPALKDPVGSSLRFRLFGHADGKAVLSRMGVDFAIANVALIAASLCRLVTSRQLSSADPIGSVAQRVNASFAVNAAWFGLTAIALLALTGFYRPLPSGRLHDRLIAAAKTCIAGFVLQVLFGALALGRPLPALELGIPAWAMLFGGLALTRVSRRSFSSYFQLIPKSEHRGNSQIESVLVVGGAGYVGSELVRQLLSSGYQVRVLDLQLFGLEPLADLLNNKRLQVQKGDFRNIEHVTKALRGMDAVVHLAAIVGDPACAIDEDTTIAVNYQAARMMAQMARANGISRFVFASTCSVYGAADGKGEISEGGALNPVSLYATTKIDAEQALLETADDVFQPTLLRFGTAYGLSHRPRFDLVANLFSAQAVTSGKISVFNGHYARPFIHVRDMARACHLCLEAPLRLVGNETFNVGDESQNYTISELGQMVAQHVPGTQVEESSDDSDPRSYRVSFDRIRSTLGFRASVDVSEGVLEMVEAVRDGHVGDWRDPIYSNSLQMKEFGLSALKFPEPQRSSERDMPATSEFLRRAA
ncbi:NAD-dependent epimerase/dehydratase family protein [Fuerstiella marisgermanici]|uniref:UDP-glucose 4-epimerase n=1 Tax=Fuerstiella marisgermanici TaxID=1891926 RepID=A0A1P8WKZ3_9PLAN|nr:NAD(P)-dependent oxidoreductase [Fuerstiella marisgermanici]APZ94734.1 UDP-glucose 4-epimerase [Fuerstiella marisgermanici]